MTPLPLDEARDEHRHGGKAVSLGAAIRAGLPVPGGLVLDVDLVRTLATGDVLKDAAEEAMARHLGPLLGRSAVAVRSSASGEDSSAASFAGQHVTLLNVTSLTAVVAAVCEVHASAHAPSALAYRERMGIAGAPRVAAVVQSMVVPECAGVLFTRNPLNGTDERVIEASWGLGEAVVSGLVTPDRWHMRRGGEVLDFLPGHKDLEILIAPDGGTIEADVDPERCSRPCLDAGLLMELERLAHACETHFARPSDIEWAVAGGRLHLLQCRPVTR